MQTSPTRMQRSLQERVFHAVTFEIIAIATSVPLLAWLMKTSMTTMGALTLLISLTAMLWNMTYNALFDRVQEHLRFHRTVAIRVLHALGFETGLALITIPMAAIWLSISLWAALKLEAAVLLFFLPFTLLFNWVYDRLRARWVT